MRNKVILWAPRLLGILYIVFISLFALDVFQEGYSVPETVVALTMHLLPSMVLAVVLAIAWRNRKLGALIFGVLAVLFTLFWNADREPMIFALLILPMIIIAVLFFISRKVTTPV